MQSRWSNTKVSGDLSLRAYSSRLLGAEMDLVLHGGGNTSVKTDEKDHTGSPTAVLRVKGSGSDLSTITEEGFTGMRMRDLLAAGDIESMDDIAMMEYLNRSKIDPSEASPSVETFLHAFIPFKFVDHTHADSVVALTNTNLNDDVLKEKLGNVVVFPYIQPGFKLAKAILERIDEVKKAEGIVLRKHGLFTYSNNAEQSYTKHIEIVTKAENYIAGTTKGTIFSPKYVKSQIETTDFLPKLRGLVSGYSKKVLEVNTGETALEIANSAEAEELCKYGPTTTDMLIRTKHDFLYIPEISNLTELVEDYRKNYAKEHSQYAPSYPIHDPNPSVIVVRGFGIVTQSTSKRDAKIIMDDAVHSLIVGAKSRKLGKHEFVSRQEAFAMEYWPFQEAKLRKHIPGKFQGTVTVVTGAAAGIGLEAFRTLSMNGSHVVAIDIDPGISNAGQEVLEESGVENLAIKADLSDEDQIKGAIELAVNKFGGIDFVFNNAGILKTAPIDQINAAEMDLMYRVNSRGTFLITREAFRVMKAQEIGGAFVFNITKNLTTPGSEMAMYGTTKAFAAQLSRYVAKEGGKYRIRSNIINPDKVFRGSKIWEGGVLESRAKAKGQTVEQYKTQKLLGVDVLPSLVVGVMMALLDDSVFGATTDCMIPVDGGIK